MIKWAGIKFGRGFWIRKCGEEFVACRSLIDALIGIGSPSLTFLYGNKELQQMYEGKKFFRKKEKSNER